MKIITMREMGLNKPKERGNMYLLQYAQSRISENSQFWKACLEVARTHPELCAEEVELRTVRGTLGLSSF